MKINFNKITLMLAIILILYVVSDGYKKRYDVINEDSVLADNGENDDVQKTPKNKSFKLYTENDSLINKMINSVVSPLLENEEIRNKIAQSAMNNNNVQNKQKIQSDKNDQLKESYVDLPYDFIKVEKFEKKIGKGEGLTEGQEYKITFNTYIENHEDKLLSSASNVIYSKSSLPLSLYSMLRGMKRGSKRIIFTDENEINIINSALKKAIIPVDETIVNATKKLENGEKMKILVEIEIF